MCTSKTWWKLKKLGKILATLLCWLPIVYKQTPHSSMFYKCFIEFFFKPFFFPPACRKCPPNTQANSGFWYLNWNDLPGNMRTRRSSANFTKDEVRDVIITLLVSWRHGYVWCWCNNDVMSQLLKPILVFRILFLRNTNAFSNKIK